jgi:hypothetical protein
MTNHAVMNAFRIAHEHQLHTSAFVMIGLPDETTEEMFATIDLLGAIRPGRFRWSLFFPYPGTVAHEMAKQKGLIDFQKMRTLTNFTEESCLDFGEAHNLLVDKLARAFPWFVNARSNSSSSTIYRGLVREIENMDRTAWEGARDTIRSMDQEISGFLRKAGGEHYAIRYNDFMGVRSDWFDQ